MNKNILKILQYIFILFSLIVIIYGILFYINQNINIKYYFDDCLPNANINQIPIFQKEFFIELILYSKIIILYAIYGMFLLIYSIKKR